MIIYVMESIKGCNGDNVKESIYNSFLNFLKKKELLVNVQLKVFMNVAPKEIYKI